MAIVDRSFTVGKGRTGFLLIHGLGGTPIELKFVAKGLARRGFLVHSPWSRSQFAQLCPEGRAANANAAHLAAREKKKRQGAREPRRQAEGRSILIDVQPLQWRLGSSAPWRFF